MTAAHAALDPAMDPEVHSIDSWAALQRRAPPIASNPQAIPIFIAALSSTAHIRLRHVHRQAAYIESRKIVYFKSSLFYSMSVHAHELSAPAYVYGVSQQSHVQSCYRISIPL